TLIVGNFVRADVTYLKQDFSVPQPVIKPGLWPVEQRYDYVVRTRKPTPQEQAALEANPNECPQKQAVLFALPELKADQTDAAAPAPAAAADQPPRATKKTFAVGDRVEAQSRSVDWRPAVVLSVRNGQHLVQYDQGGGEWLSSDRLRMKVWE